jgi:hypothetical protein
VPGGLDENVGRVAPNGKVYGRRPGLSADRLLGRVEGEPRLLAGAAAYFLLLVDE